MPTESSLKPTEQRAPRWPLSGLASAYLTLFLIVMALETPGMLSSYGRDGSLAGMFSSMLVLPVALPISLLMESLNFPLRVRVNSVGAILMLVVFALIMIGIIELAVRLTRRVIGYGVRKN